MLSQGYWIIMFSRRACFKLFNLSLSQFFLAVKGLVLHSESVDFENRLIDALLKLKVFGSGLLNELC